MSKITTLVVVVLFIFVGYNSAQDTPSNKFKDQLSKIYVLVKLKLNLFKFTACAGFPCKNQKLGLTECEELENSYVCHCPYVSKSNLKKLVKLEFKNSNYFKGY